MYVPCLLLCIFHSYCYVCSILIVKYVSFLLLFMFRSRYCVSLCCSVYCLCVNVCCTTATGRSTQLHLTVYQYQYQKRLLTFGVSVWLSVSMSAYNNWAPTGQICVKFDTGVIIMKITNKMQLYRLIYYTLSALHVLSDDSCPSSRALDCIYSIW
jgi:hypothetical protein